MQYTSKLKNMGDWQRRRYRGFYKFNSHQSPKLCTVTISDAVLTVNIDTSWEGRQLLIFNSPAFRAWLGTKFCTCHLDLLEHKAT